MIISVGYKNFVLNRCKYFQQGEGACMGILQILCMSIYIDLKIAGLLADGLAGWRGCGHHSGSSENVTLQPGHRPLHPHTSGGMSGYNDSLMLSELINH